jgi:hypothetical protein
MCLKIDVTKIWKFLRKFLETKQALSCTLKSQVAGGTRMVAERTHPAAFPLRAPTKKVHRTPAFNNIVKFDEKTMHIF